jgi:osmotically-inducible protein OsmY
VVTLKGTVKSGGLKGVATRMARRVDCVKRVDNQLSVEQSSKSNDEAKKSGR